MMGYFSQTVIDALSWGGLYALAALGIGLLYGVLRVINFAHGDFITVGAFSLIVPSTQATAQLALGALPAPLLIIGTLLVVTLVALLSDLLVFRPLRGATPSTIMIASFALGYVIQNIVLLLYSSRPKAVDLWPELNEAFGFAGLRIPQLQIWTVTVAALLMVALTVFLKASSYGIEMRAASEDLRMARLLGVRANRVIALAVALSGALAGAVSLIIATQSGVVSYQMGGPVMLFAFIGTIIGGMGSLVGSALGGFAVGFSSVILQAYLPDDIRPFRDAILFALVILILVIRPQGLILVKTMRERV
ncbi:High-affinity branched-chain amino acid transport system permease protein LivH [Ensifer psoraleae]|uniref:branched-chain amino acid ABC transporter permease n=1 Tax=Sinorhizobium psoraleae TaxID=520838 RepID=UPI0024AB189E|nr:branched-chain amino acid ABC transporter permease [Sinorhizobium psoraleae]NRP75626.1 High-affinity branched-chain amino acid transport system permease protein LivH [Sinorhizobium psoraleae]